MMVSPSPFLFRESRNNLALSSWLSLVYLAIPEAIYLLGWVRPLFAFPLVALLLVILLLPVSRGELTNDFATLSKKDWIAIIASFAVCACALFCTGITDNWKQTPDFKVRHDILYTLSYADWPTIMEDGKYFVYYFQSFLPAALFAKWVSWVTLQWLEFVWLCVGGFLIFVVMFSVFGRWVLLFALALFGWNGLSFIPNLLVEYIGKTGICGELDVNLGLPYLSYRVAYPLGALKASPYWPIHLFVVFALSLDGYTLRRFGAFIGACVVVYAPMAALAFLPTLLFLCLRCYSREGQSGVASFKNLVREQVSSPVTLLVSLAIVSIMGVFYTLTNSDNTLVNMPLSYFPFALGRFGLLWVFNMGVLVGIYYLTGEKCREIWFFAVLQLFCISLSAFFCYDVAYKGNMVCVWYGICYLVWAMSAATPKRRIWALIAYVLIIFYAIYRTPSLCISVGVALCICAGVTLGRNGRIFLSCAVVAAVVFLGVLCPSARDSVLDNLKGRNLHYSSPIGIYQEDGGSGGWWWYRAFPQVDDVPAFLFRK